MFSLFLCCARPRATEQDFAQPFCLLFPTLLEVLLLLVVLAKEDSNSTSSPEEQ